MTIHISVHLFFDGAPLDGLLKEDWQELRSYGPASHFSPGFYCRLHLKHKPVRMPDWGTFIQDPFGLDPSQLMSQSVSAVLIVEVEKRYFALTFGHGHTGLSKDYLDREFGLRVALNSVEVDQVKAVQTRTVERNSLLQSRMATEAGRLAALRVELDQEWVRSIEGKARGDLGAISGSQSVKLKWDGTLKGLAPRLASLLELAESLEYRERFPGIDQIRPVDPGSEVHQSLDELLRQAIKQGTADPVALSYRRSCGWEAPVIARYRIFAGHTKLEFTDLTLHNVRTLHSRVAHRDPFDVKIMSLDEDGEEGRREKLHDCLVAEFRFEGADYVFLEGRWFRLAPDVLKKIQRQIDAVPDITDHLRMPAWMPGEAEADYNQRVALERGWICGDRSLIHYSYDKIEPCDLLSAPHPASVHLPPGDLGPLLVAVKKADSSAVLSHLFAQGNVTAVLMREEEPKFKRKLEELYAIRATQPEGDAYRTAPDFERAVIVFGIATEKPGRLAESLFLFSKIQLLRQLYTIRLTGLRYALCRIDLQTSARALAPV